MKKTVIIIFGVLFLISIVLNVLFLTKRNEVEVQQYRESVIDTIPFYVPVPKDSTVLNYVTEVVPIDKNETIRETVRDTITTIIAETIPGKSEGPDSVSIKIPIIQKVYVDTLYRAYVSGYNVNLDSIFVNRVTDYVYETKVIPAKMKRFNLGVQAGYGYTPKGFQPFIGVGVTYSLFSF